mmetsp:Transcript_29037/g.55778  ORF Transcript_29037/g.55778 Transcript_29037/m.55778 type:complete len:335 (+) Transcript_29037:4240-5244(+)
MGTKGPASNRLLRKSGDAGQVLALHPFQKRATGGGDIGKVLRHTRLVQGRNGIAAPGHGDQVAGFGQCCGGLGGGNGRCVKGGDFKGPERPVPDQRFEGGKGLRNLGRGCVPGVQHHLIPRQDGARIQSNNLMGCTGGELACHAPIGGQDHAAARRVGGGQNVAGCVVQIGLLQGRAQLRALGGEERIGHAAADHQHIDFLDQVFQQVELGRHLCPAHNSTDRAFGGRKGGFQRAELSLHQPSRAIGQQMRHAGGRGMGAVRGREGIVAEHIAQRGKKLRHLGIVGLFHRGETGVFHQDHGVRRLGIDKLPRGAFNKGDRTAKRRFEVGYQRAQ